MAWLGLYMHAALGISLSIARDKTQEAMGEVHAHARDGQELLRSCAKEEAYFVQRLDHFTFARGQEATFKQRYVLCSDVFSQGSPIFFYGACFCGLKS